MKEFVAWLAPALEKRGTQVELAKKLGIEQSRVSEMKAGRRRPQLKELKILQDFVGKPLPPRIAESLKVQVPVLGLAGAANAHGYYALSDGTDTFVEPPTFDSPTESAVDLRGGSLGDIFNDWIVFYDHVYTPPSPKLLKQLCVCWLEDGRVLIKQLMKGSAPGYYTLRSQTEGWIEDVAVKAAARVKAMAPR